MLRLNVMEIAKSDNPEGALDAILLPMGYRKSTKGFTLEFALYENLQEGATVILWGSEKESAIWITARLDHHNHFIHYGFEGSGFYCYIFTNDTKDLSLLVDAYTAEYAIKQANLIECSDLHEQIKLSKKILNGVDGFE